MSTVVKDLGAVSAYAYAVEKGYTGTEAEFAELMADYAEVGQRAEDAADSALNSKTAAQTAATTATNKASEAASSATTATTAAEAAQADADAAALDASQALSAASTATSKATEATTAAATAVSAKDDAVSANTAAQSAKTAAQTAQTGAETAAASVQSSAAQIQTNADDISELKEDLTTKADLDELYKAFPTDTASGSVASFADGANVPVKSLIVNIDPVQSGSGDPSPDNVRPISGHTQAVVTRTGVNVWDEEWELGIYSLSDGLPVPNSSSIRGKNRIVAKPSTDYYCNNNNIRVLYYDESDNYLGFVGGFGIKTTPTNCAYIRMYLGNDYGTTYNHDVCINYPSTDTDYHPYSGQSINIQLGQTVYGGTLDVVSGELVIDRAMQELDGSGTIAMGHAGSGDAAFRYFQWGNDYAVDTNVWETDVIANFLVTITGGRGARVQYNAEKCPRIIVPESGSLFETVEDLKAYLNETHLTIVYPLATPITVTLTPNELSTLLGANNIWADTGDSTVEYRADPTLYIGRLTEPDADMVADSNITSGSYFMVGNTLYKATANIASGATISPNVNCTRKSLSEALNELNA